MRHILAPFSAFDNARILISIGGRVPWPCACSHLFVVPFVLLSEQRLHSPTMAKEVETQTTTKMGQGAPTPLHRAESDDSSGLEDYFVRTLMPTHRKSRGVACYASNSS